MLQLLLPAASLLFAHSSLAQFVNQDENLRNLTTISSPSDSDVIVSFKEPHGACRTAIDGQKQYTGWVNVPGDYPTNLFFWYVGAREETDSLTIWLNGGPGSSSMYGFFTGNGPCSVVEKGLNDYESVAREWGWDRGSNMLFIDQPNQVGYSYNTPTNGTFRPMRGTYDQPPPGPRDDLPAWAQLNGTFSDMRGNAVNQTANTTQLAATAIWHMLQGFLTTIPPFANRTDSSLDVHLFAESYGGRYGPIFAETFETQNRRRQEGSLSNETTRDINLKSLGIVNGCVDREIQMPFYPVFANNNTYGFKAMSDYDASYLADRFNAKGGCKDFIGRCARAAAESDPDGDGDDERVNQICISARKTCAEIEGTYYEANRSPYDLASPLQDPFPSLMYEEYLNQAWVLEAVGSPVNFSQTSTNVFDGFLETGDIDRDGNIPRLASLLNSGIRVGLIYGDRDYICNWMGGEAVALQVANEAGAEYSTGYSDAGYAPIIVNESYIGGAVRQFANLSFSRVYQAGHAVPAYQPETAFQIFARILAGASVSTGSTSLSLSEYRTEGPGESPEWNQKLPPMPEPTCFVREWAFTCDLDSRAMARNGLGSGVVINGVYYKSEKDWPLYEDDDDDEATESSSSSSSSSSGTAPTATGALTEASTATTTPEGENAALGTVVRKGGLLMGLLVTMVVVL